MRAQPHLSLDADAPYALSILNEPKLTHLFGLAWRDQDVDSRVAHTFRSLECMRHVASRARLFDSEKFRQRWVETLGKLGRELGFKIIGYGAGAEAVSVSAIPKGVVWTGREAHSTEPCRAAGSMT